MAYTKVGELDAGNDHSAYCLVLIFQVKSLSALNETNNSFSTQKMNKINLEKDIAAIPVLCADRMTY